MSLVPECGHGANRVTCSFCFSAFGSLERNTHARESRRRIRHATAQGSCVKRVFVLFCAIPAKKSCQKPTWNWVRAQYGGARDWYCRTAAHGMRNPPARAVATFQCRGTPTLHRHGTIRAPKIVRHRPTTGDWYSRRRNSRVRLGLAGCCASRCRLRAEAGELHASMQGPPGAT